MLAEKFDQLSTTVTVIHVKIALSELTITSRFVRSSSGSMILIFLECKWLIMFSVDALRILRALRMGFWDVAKSSTQASC